MDTPKELLTAYQRWEMNSFGDERPSALARRAQEPQAPSAEALEAIREQARAEGFEQGRSAGYDDGLALGRREAARELTHLRAMATEFGHAVAHADETISNEVLDLALHLARSMLRSALPVKPELLLPLVREAIAYLPVLQQPASLMLNPQDAELVREMMGEELDKSGWRIVDDATITRGGCKLDTPSNQIDAQAETRWARLAHALGKNLEWLD